MSALLPDGRNLLDLKVVELKDELEIRGLPRTGNKQVLIDRLCESLLTDSKSVDSSKCQRPSVADNNEDEEEKEEDDQSNDTVAADSTQPISKNSSNVKESADKMGVNGDADGNQNDPGNNNSKPDNKTDFVSDTNNKTDDETNLDDRHPPRVLHRDNLSSSTASSGVDLDTSNNKPTLSAPVVETDGKGAETVPIDSKGEATNVVESRRRKNGCAISPGRIASANSSDHDDKNDDVDGDTSGGGTVGDNRRSSSDSKGGAVGGNCSTTSTVKKSSRNTVTDKLKNTIPNGIGPNEEIDRGSDKGDAEDAAVEDDAQSEVDAAEEERRRERSMAPSPPEPKVRSKDEESEEIEMTTAVDEDEDLSGVGITGGDAVGVSVGAGDLRDEVELSVRDEEAQPGETDSGRGDGSEDGQAGIQRKSHRLSVDTTSEGSVGALDSSGASKEPRPPRKRKWGKTKSIISKVPMAISTESLKEICGPVSKSEIPLSLTDLPNEDEPVGEAVAPVAELSMDPWEMSEDYELDEAGSDVDEKKLKHEGGVVEEKETETNDDLEDGEARDEIAEEQSLSKRIVVKCEDGDSDAKVQVKRSIRRISDPSHGETENLVKGKEGSPARYPPNQVLLIRNLVRPFTEKNLRALLSSHGKFDPEDFYLDSIKTHCVVKYESEEVAVQAREAMHNLIWPPGNTNMMRIDFANQDLLDERLGRKKIEVTAPTAPLTPPRPGEFESTRFKNRETKDTTDKPQTKSAEKINKTEEERKSRRHRSRSGDGSRDRKRKDRSGGGQRDANWPKSREWDQGKNWGKGESPPRERERRLSRDRKMRSRERVRTPQKKVSPDAPPAKLLDELFRKTRATPSVYWLPLNEEEIIERNKLREQEMADRNQRRRQDDNEWSRNRAARRTPPTPERYEMAMAMGMRGPPQGPMDGRRGRGWR